MKVFILLIFFIFSIAVNAQTEAGKVAFVFGKVNAIDANGTSRGLKKDDKVFSKDKLITGQGRLQLHMRDGAFISVQPDSEYLIEDYKFNSQQDGSESAVYRLLKGGIRAITGLIGKKNRDAYKVHTPAATIGIRGTGHNTRICAGNCFGPEGNQLDDGLYHSTTEGTTFVQNETGTIEVPTGQSVFVANSNSKAKKQDEPSASTSSQSSGGDFQGGEQVDENGLPQAFADIVVRAETGTQAFYAYNHNQGSVSEEYFAVILNASDDGTANEQIFINSNANLIRFEQSGCPFSTPCSYNGEGIQLTDVGRSKEYGFAWARTALTGWTFDGDSNVLLGSFHAITLQKGNQTVNIPIAGVATYNKIIGATAPTGSSTNGGVLSSVNIGINFGTAQFESFDLQGTNGNGMQFSSSINGTPTVTQSGAVPLQGICTGNCAGSTLSGVAHYGLSGANAEAIGFSYGLHSDSVLNTDVVSGAALVTQ